MKHSPRISLFCTLVFFASLSCRGNQAKAPKSASGDAASGGSILEQARDIKDGLTILLSDGKGLSVAGDARKETQGKALQDTSVSGLLKRLPKIASSGQDTKEFALRKGSKPPPLSGEDVRESFPAAEAGGVKPAVSGSLEVLRVSPEGKVPIAPKLSVTFSQPMVAVTSQDEAKKTQPVTLSPQPSGTWRWIGTKTLLFDPDVRMPMATRYEVVVPKGTKSASGASLGKEVRFQFETPAPTLEASYPTGGPQVLEPLIYLAFDQEIDPASVIPMVSLEAKGKRYEVREATDEEIAADEAVNAMVLRQEQRDAGIRYLVVTPKGKLPKAATVSVDVAAKTPSVEGPLTTTKAQSSHFETFGPFKIEESRCGWGRECPPGSSFNIVFTNPIDEDDFDPEAIKIEPELDGARIEARGNQLIVFGHSLPRTTYKVRIPVSLTDRFGQRFGESASRNFRVGDARPYLSGSGGLTVADPIAKKPTFDVHSMSVRSLDVQVYRVNPSDWATFGKFMQGNTRRPQPAPGTKVFDKDVEVSGPDNRMATTKIDISPALNKEGYGHAVVVVTPSNWPNRYPPKVISWVQVTQIGLDALADSGELVVWTNALSDGRPLAGTEVKLTEGGGSAKTASEGLATLSLSDRNSVKGHQLLIATRGTDTAFLPQSESYWSDRSGFFSREQKDYLRVFTFDDRGMYKPGETVNIKGWQRTFQAGRGGDIFLDEVARVSYTVFGARGNKIGKGSAKVSGLGGFDFDFKLPENANLGYGRVELSLSAEGVRSARTSHSFQIQEFRRPEFEVLSKTGQGPFKVGGGADVEVSAKYYAGGPLANAEVYWQVSSSETTFTPPNRDGYIFGTWSPWWGGGFYRGYRPVPPPETQSFEGKTDAGGKHTLHMDFISVKPPRPHSVTASSRVMDVNRQAWTSSASLLVHPSNLYVGLRRDRYFVDKGDPIEVAGIVSDHDGKLIADAKVELRAVRLEWVYSKGEYKQEERDEQICEVVSGADEFNCTFKTPEGGSYRIIATVSDQDGRPNQSEFTMWVSGGETPPERNVVQEEVTLIPDRKEYAGGDTAKLLVQAPFAPAEGLLTLQRSGIIEVRRFTMDGTTTTLEIAIKEGHVPNLHAQVDLVGAAVRVDAKGKRDPSVPKRPAYASGSINLSVPPKSRTLAVKVVPQESELAPGAKTSISVEVRDAVGDLVPNAEVSAIIVDEAVLALSGYQTPNPLSAFYGHRAAEVYAYHQRKWLRLSELQALQTAGVDQTGDAMGNLEGSTGEAPMEEAESKPMMSAMADGNGTPPPPSPGAPMPKRTGSGVSRDGGGGQAPIAVRQNFAALATFAPEVKTNAKGVATVGLTLPDNLTRYRVMVVAAANENHFGSTEQNITARKPIMLRPAPPRFLNFGDHFELPVVVQNQTNEAKEVRVAVRASNAALTGVKGKVVTVPANDRVELRFDAAAELAGTARFQVVAESGRITDASEFLLPVWTPATAEAFATYGEIDEGGIEQAIRMPPDVVKTFGGLEITTSSTQLQALTDALLYLVQYPYECTEQTSSRIMAIAALRDVLDAFEAKGMLSKDAMNTAVERDIKRLSSLQNWDGGFAFWVKGRESWPYISIHAAHALSRAKDKGYSVPDEMLERSKNYLSNIASHIPSYYSEKSKRMLRAYALYARKRIGDRDIRAARQLLGEVELEEHSMESLGWLISVLHADPSSKDELAKVHRFLGNKVTETAGAANWVSGYSDDAHLVLHSSRRTDAVLLEALIEDQPKSDLIAKVVRGLMAHRKKGSWQNTQENVFVLLAMDAYFEKFEKITPNFVAKMWLGDAFAGSTSFRGRGTTRHHTEIPMEYLARSDVEKELVLSKKGKGRLYYRIGMRYAPSNLNLPAADYGFAVERSYEAVDDPEDVVRQKDGTWKIRAGAQVRVRLVMAAENRRYHVALVDPLPAGLEALNPALAVTGEIPRDPKEQSKNSASYWWRSTWYEHQNMRDERVEAFTSYLWAGVHEYSYVARATTPGRFVVPPSKAEEMYSPETFGRSAGDIVVVE